MLPQEDDDGDDDDEQDDVSECDVVVTCHDGCCRWQFPALELCVDGIKYQAGRWPIQEDIINGFDGLGSIAIIGFNIESR